MTERINYTTDLTYKIEKATIFSIRDVRVTVEYEMYGSEVEWWAPIRFCIVGALIEEGSDLYDVLCDAWDRNEARDKIEVIEQREGYSGQYVENYTDGHGPIGG